MPICGSQDAFSMVMKQPGTPINENQIAEVLDLLKDADSVELKLTVPDTDHQSSISALDIDVLDAELRQVVFFDTPDLKLNRLGMVVRARRIPGGGDTVVKLRPIVPAELPGDLRRSGSFNVEVDAMPGSIVCSGSLRAKADNGDVKLVLMGRQRIRKLFTSEQRALYREHAPKDLELDSLRPIGPINIAKLKFTTNGFKRFIAAEMWFYPDGSRLLELSIKCTPNKAFQVLGELRAFLTQRGISLMGKQDTKTRKTLRYFSDLNRRPGARSRRR
jgi:hypothetical protein